MDNIKNNERRFAIGMAIEGGFFAGIVQADGKRYGLVVAPKIPGEISGPWGEYGKEIDAAHVADGLANTRAMADAGSEIAKLALSLDIDGHQDWYIPARDELELIYRNLKPTDNENYCGFRDGDNPSSLPAGLPYKKSDPAQTSSEIFQNGGAEAMEDTWYWSSSQYSALNAFIQDFGDGDQIITIKDRPPRVRAVRRFLID